MTSDPGIYIFRGYIYTMVDKGYPSDWDSRRQAVYKRDDHTCQNCGRSGQGAGVDLHAHHIVPKSNGGTHSKTNLTTMCSECHGAIHNDAQAPTSVETAQASSHLTNYQDVFELLTSTQEFLQNNGVLHLTAFRDEVGPDQILPNYEQLGKRVREQLHNTKRKASGFDPYDNADSDHVEQEFKDVMSEFLDYIIDWCDQYLEVDRLLKKYVQELVNVSCSECGTTNQESDSYCGECGSEIRTLSRCTDCGEFRKEIQQEFCKSCGEELADYPQSRLEQINLTVTRLEEEKRTLDDVMVELSDLMDGKVTPLWKEQLR